MTRIQARTRAGKARPSAPTLKLPEGENITTGTVRYGDLRYLLTSIEELVQKNVPFSRIYSIDGDEEGSIDVDWLACSATACKVPTERFLALAEKGGHVLRIGGGETEFESLAGCQKGFKRKPGLMREIRAIAGRAYAVGTGRQAYRREGEGRWSCIDQWSTTDSKKLVDFSFESIDGFSEQDIYAVGWRGEIWHFDGKKWRQIESPTTLSLHKVRCAGDKTVYAAGKEGLLLRGHGEQWEIVRHESTEEDIWGLEWFNHRLYLSTTNLVYTLEGTKLIPIDYKQASIPGTCYHLSAADGILWSIGQRDVMEFDGRTWRRIV